MQPGEIYLARFPFGDVPGMKLRPVLLLTGSIGPIPEVIVAYVSSVIPSELLPSDFIIDPARAEFRNSHLKAVSALRLHKLATLHGSSLVRLLGLLESPHFAAVAAKLRVLLSL